MQLQVQSNPLKGFWLVSAAAFLVAPFLTNDGVCLLFVELILDAFEATKALSNNSIVANACTAEDRENIVKLKEMPLETGDAIYFLLTLACSANIGSALTYTGLIRYYLILSTHDMIQFLIYRNSGNVRRQSSEHDCSTGCNGRYAPIKISRHHAPSLYSSLAYQ